MSTKLGLILSSFALTAAVAVSSALAQGQAAPPPDAKMAKPAAPAAAAPAAATAAAPAAPAAPAPAAAAAAAPAAAASGAAPVGIRPDSPCKQDIETLCPNIEPGMGRIYKCLGEKESELSNSCKARLAELRATGGECKADIEKFCASVPHTRGKLAECLSAHHDELSEGCKTLSVRAKGAIAPAAAPAAPAVQDSTAAPAAPKAQEPAPAPAPEAKPR